MTRVPSSSPRPRLSSYALQRSNRRRNLTRYGTCRLRHSLIPTLVQTEVSLVPEVPQKATLRLRGAVPMELWNSIGIKVLTKLKAGEEMNLSVNLSVQIDSDRFQSLEQEVKQALADLNLGEQVSMSRDPL